MELMTMLQEIYETGIAKRAVEECNRTRRLQDAKFRRGHEWTRVSLQTRPATPIEYTEWLHGYIKKGGEPTTFEPTGIPTNFYVATADINLPAWDDDPVNIIVPANVVVHHQRLGLNCLFYMRDFTHKGFTVPVYSDTL